MTNRGILFKKGSALENISRLDMVLFDKTGTLTTGTPSVTGVFPAKGITQEQLLSWGTSAEINSTHPLAPAVTDFAREKGIGLETTSDVAKETCEVVLVKNDLNDVDRAVRLGKKNLSTIKRNFFWAFFYNILMIPVVAGILYPAFRISLTPEVAAIAMWFSSLSVVGNSLLLNRFVKQMDA